MNTKPEQKKQPLKFRDDFLPHPTTLLERVMFDKLATARRDIIQLSQGLDPKEVDPVHGRLPATVFLQVMLDFSIGVTSAIEAEAEGDLRQKIRDYVETVFRENDRHVREHAEQHDRMLQAMREMSETREERLN